MRLSLILLVSLALGCAAPTPDSEEGSQSQPSQEEPKPAEPSLTPAPDLSLPADHSWSPYFGEGTTYSVRAGQPEAGVSQGEHDAFVEAFRRTLLGQQGFVAAEGGARPDFTAEPTYSVVLQGTRLLATSTCQLIGGVSCGTRAYAARLQHPQESTPAAEAKIRLAHAEVVGRLLAESLLQKLARARVRYSYEVVFKGADRAMQQELVELIRKLEGVEEGSLRARSTGRGPTKLAFDCALAPQGVLAKLEQAVDEAFGATVEAPAPTLLIVTAP